MATQAAIRREILRKLYTSEPGIKPFETTLSGTISAGATSMTVPDGTNWDIGDVVHFDDGDEALVTAVAGNTLTIGRDYNPDISATGHTAGDFIEKSPRVTIQKVDDAISEVLDELPKAGVHVWGTGSITLDATKDSYPLTNTDILTPPGVIGLYFEADADELVHPIPFRWHGQLHTDIQASPSQRIEFTEWGDKASGEKVYYTYAKIPADVTEILARQEPIVVNGAVYKIMGGLIPSEGQDPGKRTNRSRQGGDTRRDSQWFQIEYLRLTREEQAQLKFEVSQFVPKDMATARARRWTW